LNGKNQNVPSRRHLHHSSIGRNKHMRASSRTHHSLFNRNEYIHASSCVNGSFNQQLHLPHSSSKHQPISSNNSIHTKKIGNSHDNRSSSSDNKKYNYVTRPSDQDILAHSSGTTMSFQAVNEVRQARIVKFKAELTDNMENENFFSCEEEA
jgi:hypothetical protein